MIVLSVVCHLRVRSQILLLTGIVSKLRSSSLHLLCFVIHYLVISCTVNAICRRLTDLPGDFFAIGCSDREFTWCADLDSLVFSRIENLENILAEVVTGTGFHRSTLEQHLDVSQLSEVEVSFLVKRIVLKLELRNCSFKLACLSCASPCPSSNGRASSSCTNRWSCCSTTDLMPSVASRSCGCRWTRTCTSSSSWSSCRSRQPSNFSTAQNVVKCCILPATERIIGLTVVVFLKISLQPLTEFKIVKIPSLDQLGDIDVPLDAILVKCSLKNFIVLNEFVLVFCWPLDSWKGKRARI